MAYPIPPIVIPTNPATNITPFTYRDGLTYLQRLERIVKYINKVIIPHVNDSYGELAETTEEEINLLITQVNALIDQIIGSSIELQDPVMAGIISDFESLTANTLNTAIISKLETSVGINVLDYGATGDGISDDTIAIQSAADAAVSNDATLVIPSGTYRISETLNIIGNINAFSATLLYNGTGTAIKIGDDTTFISGKEFTLPHIIHNPAQWRDDSVGIDIVNIYCSNIRFNRVEKFDVGVRFRGAGRGCVYNTVVLGYLLDNRINLLLTNDETGWCNENLFIGGRFHHIETGSLGVTASTDTHHIMFKRESTTLGGPNNNVFMKPSIEGNSVNQYRVVFDNSRYNAIISGRWETGGGTPGKIKYIGESAFNRIIGGYDLRLIQEDFSEASTGATGGIIDDSQGARILIRSKAAQTIPNNEATKLTWEPSGEMLRRVTYNNGVFTPRPGEWNVSVQIAFDANATGIRTAQIKNLAGATIAQIQATPSSGTRCYMALTTRISEPFYIEAYQNSGAPLSTSSGTGNCTLTAEYVY